MKKYIISAAAAACCLRLALLPAAAQEPAKAAPSPGEIVAAAPLTDWVEISPFDLLVMDLAPDAKGKPRQVIIQLMPPPFSQGWIGNIRKLAAAHWWDGTSINRVQDNYVVQWGDATEMKALPSGLVTPNEKDYEVATVTEAEDQFGIIGPDGAFEDPYAKLNFIYQGWPIASDWERQWPIHCYGMVGVGRNLSPDTGSGAELYTVIGHAPRHLDRNIALVGRVIEGIEHLSSLPRGTGALGFYETAAERVEILKIRMGNELTQSERPAFQMLRTNPTSFEAFKVNEGGWRQHSTILDKAKVGSFAAYADARANRRDPFFIKPAGGADICNIPVPVRRRP